MTAVDNSSKLMQQLISSCYHAQHDFLMAAAAVEEPTWKRLFERCAQQRTRFAEELREHCPLMAVSDVETAASVQATESPDNSWLEKCLQTESRTRELYRQALLDHRFPTKTQFLISSQWALMQRVHERVSDLATSPEISRIVAERTAIPA